MCTVKYRRCFLFVVSLSLLNSLAVAQPPTSGTITYKNQGCGYQLKLPADSQVSSNLNRSYVDNLQKHKLMLGSLKQSFLKSHQPKLSCSLHVKLPLGQDQFKHINHIYLDVTRFTGTSDNLKLKKLTKQSTGVYPPDESVQINITPKQVQVNGHNFKKNGLLTLGDKLQEDSIFYYLYHNNNYYVLSFSAFGKSIAKLNTNTQNHDDQELNNYIQSIVKSFDTLS